MDNIRFSTYRKKLKKTQKQMAQLLGTSIKAIHSYEQGWRSIPVHVERQLYFLLAQKLCSRNGHVFCWEQRECPPEQRQLCPAWEFNSGKQCWFINGTICEGIVHNSWQEKMALCRTCSVFKAILAEIDRHE
ncbi:putative transcriptional regulator, XRE family [Desulfosarcina cetonica]|uniref:helix-turn-helix domain-containing protein n=1 Tax=Desulfosarcina cetonica TaxID=90730 RepID=UPI0006D2B2F9|nr:helix-turn-helix transcriptional regulator [Desulfosarcina cetonica]VTR67944.1 putative transcriptional regulator, XRE family [Desulfosarcina cetonica]